MGVDAKCIGGFLWKMTRVSMKFCYAYVKKYPYAAGVLSVLFFLYMFLPSIFLFLIYSAPIVVLVTLSIQIFFKTKRWKQQDSKKNGQNLSTESKPVVVCRNGDKSVIQKQLSRRRNLKQNIELDPTLNDASVVGGLKAVTCQKKVIAFGEESVRAHDDDLVGKDSLKGSDLLDHKKSAGQKSSSAKNVQAVCDDLKGKSSLYEEKLKGILEEKEESSSQNVQGSDQPGTASASNSEHAVIDQPDYGVGEGEEESSEGEDDNEEEAHKDGNNTVEWTEDDQQNLMDLGDSELERNKRLETLITKRRARKLFKMAIEKKLLDSGNASAIPIPPIFALRNNLLTVMPNSLEESCLPMPGSAPSILLPGRNPFDLPYDPMEEKPNLMADNFQQEFMTAQEKDTFFCRHESFSLGPSLIFESQQDHRNSRFNPYGLEKKNEEGHRFSRFRSQSLMSSHDQLIDELLLQEDEALSRTMSATDLVEMEGEASITNSLETSHKENKRSGKGKTRSKGESMEYLHDTETDSVKDNSTDRCSQASSSEASELSFSSNRPINIDILEAKVGPQRFSDRVQSDLTFSVFNSIGFDGSPYGSSPFGHNKSRTGDRLFYKGPCHSPGYSIASDLQVEVSEVGSPPFTVDGTVSPADAESLYDGDIDKDITSGSDEMWGATCHLAGVDENESRSREVNEVNEYDVVGLGFSAFKQNLEDPPIASSKLPDNDQGHSRNLDFSENVIQLTEEVQKSSKSSDALSSENTEKAILSLKISLAHPPHEAHSDQKPEEPSKSIEKSTEEGKVSHDMGDQVVPANNDMAKLELIGEIDGSVQLPIKQGTTEDPSQPAEKSTSESSIYTDNNSGKPAENQAIKDLEIEDSKNPMSIDGEPGKIDEHEDVGGTSNTIEGIDNLNSVQEDEDKQNITEVAVNQGFDNPTTSAPQSETVGEQLSTGSSSSSSPNSVLPGNIPTDEIPSSNYDELVHHIDVPRSVVDEIFRNNSLDEELPEDLTIADFQNSQPLVDQTNDPISTGTGSGKSEEPSVKVVEGRSESSASPEVATELSEPADRTHLGSVDHIKGKSPTLPELEKGIIAAKLAEEIAILVSDVPGNMAKVEETSNSHENLLREANVDSIKNPVVNEKEDAEKLKSAKGSQGQSETDIETSAVNEEVGEVTTSKSIEDRDENRGKLTEHEAATGPSHTVDGNESSSISMGSENIMSLPKPTSSERSLEIIEDSQGEPKNIKQDEIANTETAAVKEPTNPPGKYCREADTTNSIQNSVANVNKDKEKLKSVEVSEGESNVSNDIKDPENNEEEEKEKLTNCIQDPAIGDTEDKEKLNSEKDNDGKSTVSSNTEYPVNNGEEALEKLKSDKGSQGESPILMSEATEDDKDLPKPANSESSLEAIDDSQGESEKSENEPAMKQSIPASGAPEEKEPSNPVPQKSEEEVNTIDDVNETVANEMSNNQNLIQQENDVNQSELGENNDSLRTDEVIKSESNEPNKDTLEQLKPVESEVKASEQETNTAV